MQEEHGPGRVLNTEDHLTLKGLSTPLFCPPPLHKVWPQKAMRLLSSVCPMHRLALLPFALVTFLNVHVQ